MQDFLSENLKGRHHLKRPRCRWEDSIKIDVKEVGCECVYWIHVVHDRDRQRAFVNLRVS
jgi:hypothetical protein